jgi:trimeric autotransporter adhesin
MKRWNGLKNGRSMVLACCFVWLGLLTACSDGGQLEVAPPPPIPAVPTGLSVAYAAKSLNFSWATTTHATTYRLFEDLDGAGPLAAAVVGTATVRSFNYAIPDVLLTRLNAQYSLQACNVTGCSAQTARLQPNVDQAIGYFKASNPGVNDIFGNAIALSADGLTLAVSAYGEASISASNPSDDSAVEAGAVYVFSKASGLWQQQAMLKAPNAGTRHYFGKTLALSADGNTLAIGADGEGSNHTGTFAIMPAGNANAPDSGAVYVYARASGNWGLQSYIKASNAEAFDIFGFALALSNDGNTMVVGAWYESGGGTGTTGDPADNSVSAAGAAYVFKRSSGLWSQQAYLKASNPDAGDWFGLSVAISGDGNTIAVGAFGESSNSSANPLDNSASGAGAVYVYTQSAGVWSTQAFLKAPVPEANDAFGVYMALSENGNTLAIGAQGDDSQLTGTFSIMPADDNLAINSGAVFVFERAAGVWTQQAYLKASNARSPARFGRRLALSGNGHFLAVSAYREDGSGIGLSADSAQQTALDAGAVYLFARSGTAWLQTSYLKASNTQAGDRFGIGIAMTSDGRTIAVGAESEDSQATGVGGDQADNSLSKAGAVYLY